MSYVTVAEFKAWVSVEDTYDDTQIQLVLDAATRAIDRACGRSFTLVEGATKYVTANNPAVINLVDLVAIDSLAADSHGDRTYATTLTSTNYELLPYTDDAGGVSSRFQQVRIWPTSSVMFTPGYLVKVVGDFGYVDESGETPADIKQACLILAARLWKRRETPFGVLSVPDLGTSAQIRKTDPDVANLLDPYTRKNDWVAV